MRYSELYHLIKKSYRMHHIKDKFFPYYFRGYVSSMISDGYLNLDELVIDDPKDSNIKVAEPILKRCRCTTPKPNGYVVKGRLMCNACKKLIIKK